MPEACGRAGTRMPVQEINCFRLGYSWLGLVLRAKCGRGGVYLSLWGMGMGKIWRIRRNHGDQPAYS